jgi:O-methyltransferase
MVPMSLETRFKGVLARFGYQLRQIPDGVWRRDEGFKKALARASGRLLLDPTSCFMLHQHALKAASLPGDCAEVGVYKGGTALILASALAGTGKTVHLFDTFGGLPHPESVDRHHAGDFGDATLASVRELLKDQRVEFHPGLFPGTAEGVRAKEFCLVHVDADLYRSTLDACEFFYPRLAPGGLLVIDDYGVPTCPGVMKAVDEFFTGRPERPMYLPSGQCVVEAARRK